MAITEETPTRKNLSADALFALIHRAFQKIPDHRPPFAQIPLTDALMSAFAMFSLKDPSLLAFDQRRSDENIKAIYHINTIPCDTHLRTILDPAIVHPDLREVIPFMPEPIIKQDGQQKNDCERNAAKRFLEKLRLDHPHLKLIVIEDGLSSNAPHIRDILRHNMHFILGAKEGDHAFLFEYVLQAEKDGRVTMHEHLDKVGVRHRFRFLNEVPLNESNQDLLVNFLEYWEIHPDGRQQHFSWVTDFRLREENVRAIMRGGRARWKIENETFNTLKNQGYQFEHNFGHGKQNLSVVLAMLMMLAFLIDQTQQLCCPVFRAA